MRYLLIVFAFLCACDVDEPKPGPRLPGPPPSHPVSALHDGGVDAP